MQFQFGPFAFTFSGTFSGNPPIDIKGPDRASYVVEHQIPAREGGIVEYVGSQQPTYQIRGFLSPSQDGPFNGTSTLVLSGTSYITLNADDSLSTLRGLRGSGAQVLTIESTNAGQLYENGLFFISKATFGFEAGRSYPYYPYTLDLKGSSAATYGNSSGSSNFVGYPPGHLLGAVSGYIFMWQMAGGSGATRGEVINTLAINILSASSGNVKVAVYSGSFFSGAALVAQSAPQAVRSGLNYFPIRPSFTSKSGYAYILAFAGDAISNSGYTLGFTDNTGVNPDSSVQSGIGFSSAFPATLVPLSGAAAGVSGQQLDIFMVAGQ